ncbi:MAG: glycosyltransferase family 39 protein [Oryzomonas sp.]|uniref:glycosyltransferase family 39 protein n=1 Tax=Oryzomonas sp. TaxID=2855186 RepID=UPI0028501D53|nr:glycosyltransferase family 39 protein [Oryzomonas sp.]MDR3579220.1 glycosyltransferase family 39 protein [Oryzomonas sp.]
MKDLKAYFSPYNYPALRDMLMLLVVFGSAFFIFLGNTGLIEPDEGRYAEVPREMMEKGDFITPTLNYVKYFEKPPLHYWLNAISFKLFGLNEFAARFAGTLAGLLTVLLVYHTGRKLFGRREGLFSAFILGTSTGFLAQSRINLTDMTLTYCLSMALCCFIIAADDREQHKNRYYYLFYLFSALAVLTKGLIGFVFPAGIIFVYIAATRRWHLVKEMRLAGGTGLFLAVTVPWFALVSQRNPEFIRFFFIHEHFERFLTKVHGHYHPFWFFIPILLATMFPWSVFAVRAVVLAWSERRQRDGGHLLFLLAWATLIFLFFSASDSKLVPYILPVFPPLALLVGKMFSDVMVREEGQLFRPENVALRVLLILMAIVAVVYPHVRDLAPVLTGAGVVRPGSSLLTKQPILSLSGGVVAACLSMFMVAAIWLGCHKKDVLILFVGLCLSSYFLETTGLQVFMDGIEYRKSSKELARLAGQITPPDGSLVSFGYEQSLPFYTGRRVVVVGNKGELEFGSKRGDQENWFIEIPDFKRLWQGGQQVVVLLKQADYEQIAPQLVPAAMILEHKGKKVLICNRTIPAASRPLFSVSLDGNSANRGGTSSWFR